MKPYELIFALVSSFRFHFALSGGIIKSFCYRAVPLPFENRNVVNLSGINMASASSKRQKNYNPGCNVANPSRIKLRRGVTHQLRGTFTAFHCCSPTHKKFSLSVCVCSALHVTFFLTCKSPRKVPGLPSGIRQTSYFSILSCNGITYFLPPIYQRRLGLSGRYDKLPGE